MVNDVLKNKIPEGYKQTEVGVIPEDWEIKPIYEITVDKKISSGLYKDKKSYGKGGTPIIKLGDVFANDIFRPSTVQKVKAEEYEVKNYQVKVGDLIIALASVKLEGVGKVMHVTNLQDKTIFDHNVALIRTNDFVNSYFLSYVFKSNYIRSMIASKATQVSTTFLKSSTILKFNIALPPLSEQTTIATALSDVDELIASLEKLIDKKEAIKTGTMQQLLTGKIRLPEFATDANGQPKGVKQTDLGRIPEDWEVVNLSELGHIDPENLSSTTSPNYQFRYISLEQINKGKLSGTYTYIFSNAPSRARRILRYNDVLISTVRPNLLSHYIVRDYPSDLICSTGFSVFRSNLTKLIPAFFYQNLFANYINSQIDILITGSNYPAINSKDIRSFRLPTPSLEEQTAIATILSDMDTEIQTLQDRLDKTRDIKKGMMQQLLTGKVRLLDPKTDTSV